MSCLSIQIGKFLGWGCYVALFSAKAMIGCGPIPIDNPAEPSPDLGKFPCQLMKIHKNKKKIPNLNRVACRILFPELTGYLCSLHCFD